MKIDGIGLTPFVQINILVTEALRKVDPMNLRTVEIKQVEVDILEENTSQRDLTPYISDEKTKGCRPCRL